MLGFELHSQYDYKEFVITGKNVYYDVKKQEDAQLYMHYGYKSIFEENTVNM